MTETLRLGDHCYKIGSGATPRGGKETYSDDGPVALIRSQNVYNDRFSHAGLAFISHEQAAQLQNVEVNDGDVLLNITGDSVARAFQVDRTVLPARVNQHVAIIRPRPERVDPRFLRYFLVTPVMQALMLGLAAAGATRNALTKSMIEDFRIPAWPVKTQCAIASVLGALDDKIDLNRRMNGTLEAMARAIFKDWFVDFGPTRAKMEGCAPYLAPSIAALFPDRLDNEGKPDGWGRRSIYEITDVIYGAPFASAQFNSEKQGELLLRIRDLVNESPGVWTPEVHPKGYKVKPGDIVVGMDGEFRAYLWGGAEAWLNQRVCVFAPKRSFSAAFVRNSIIGPLADVEATEIATTVIHLGKNDIDRFSTLVPSKPIMASFNDLVQPLYDRIVESKLETRTLAVTRDLLLPKLMSGEIRVKEAEKEVQEVA